MSFGWTPTFLNMTWAETPAKTGRQTHTSGKHTGKRAEAYAGIARNCLKGENGKRTLPYIGQTEALDYRAQKQLVGRSSACSISEDFQGTGRVSWSQPKHDCFFFCMFLIWKSGRVASSNWITWNSNSDDLTSHDLWLGTLAAGSPSVPHPSRDHVVVKSRSVCDILWPINFRYVCSSLASFYFSGLVAPVCKLFQQKVDLLRIAAPLWDE